MQSKTSMIVLGLGLALYGTALGRGRINEPPPDPIVDVETVLEDLVADWNSSELNVTQGRLINTSDPKVQINAEVALPDSDHLLGVMLHSGVAQAVDELGNVYTQTPPLGGKHYRRPLLSPLTGESRPGYVSFTLDVDPDKGYPTLFSTLDWSAQVLVAKTMHDVALPFDVSEGWTEITPGLVARIDFVQASPALFQYVVRLMYDKRRIQLALGSVIRTRQENLEALVCGLHVLDDNGRVLPAEGSSGGHSTLVMDGIPTSMSRGGSSGSTGGNMEGGSAGGGSGGSAGGSSSGSADNVMATIMGSGRCDWCSTPTVIRFVYATELQTAETSLQLNDIPIPTF